ncbi:hypothetical protein KV102_18065 [Mumia sp. zg.B53]|uniref:DUF6636 domain-containing protein n=1 Tax=unclassified Mumia TaxID=2621872 RepID=UPI001C6EE025|nr:MULTISPECIES: DUF6636 domain-containing protein [unclassified Mumia]MBW9206128.1 hypothetical protein [Mumia sp. zg.B17]MBW9216751.1 hypothetical protein [Mumia sp. zg.B53]MDD9348683.1 hypothetical protein [Mumia sp.]
MHRSRSFVLARGAAILLAVALGGCGSASDLADAEPAAEASAPTTSPRTAQLPLDDVATDLTDDVGPMRAFRSPSGNIVCRLNTDGARCDIGDFDFSPPPKPEGCEDGWGRTLVVDDEGGFFSCDAPTLAGNSPELAYGKSTTLGSFGCTSQRTGITCLNTETDEGFTVSRERAGTF